MRPCLRWALSLVWSAAAAGALLGAVNGFVTAWSLPGARVLVSVWAGAGLVSLVTLPFGALQALLLLFAPLRRARGQLPSIFPRLAKGTPGDPDSRLVRAYSVALLMAGSWVFVIAGVWRVVPSLAAFQLAAARQMFLAFVLAALLVASSAGCLLVARPLRHAIARFDRAVGLPWPQSALGAATLYLLLPTLAVFLPTLARHEDDLPFLVRPLGVVVFLELQFVAWLALKAALPVARGAIIAALSIALALTALAQPWAFGALPSASKAITRGIFTAPALSVARRLTDTDGDGFSSLFGGRDCSALDRAVHPGAIDVPDNDVDENCDGVQASSSDPSVRPAPAFSNAASPASALDFNIIWIVVDALRADRMQLHGYQRANTPQLSELGASAIVFERAHSPSSTTHLSFPSLLIGKNIETIRWEYASDKVRMEPAVNQVTFAERLRASGYRTTALVSPFIAHLPSALRGFDSVQTRQSTALAHDGPAVTAAAIDALGLGSRAAGEQPFLLFLYYEDPHLPYDDHGAESADYGDSEPDDYDGEIAYVDRHIGFLLQYLRLHPETDQRTIIVVTSDHGEEFSEHGGKSHGKTCYNESTHVPLLLRVPGLQPRRVTQRVSGVDIVPTLLELVGAHADARDFDGRSLLAADGEELLPAPVFCAITNQGSTLTGRPFFQRSVRYQDRALIQQLSTGEFELYDTEADPLEQSNLASSPAEKATLDSLKLLLEANARGNFADLRLGR